MKIIFILLFKVSITFAQECPAKITIPWILSESLSSHPKLLLERLNVGIIEASKAEASKMINPELEHFSVWGKEFGNVNAYQNESRLWFTLQLASKRNKSLKAWAGQVEIAKQEEEMLKQALLKDLWINFFRVHQINKEVSVKQAVIEKLNNILLRYRERKYLSPDQSIEERIFTMVVNNFKLSLNHFIKEKNDIYFFFREVTAFKCNIQDSNFEDKKIKWPSLNELETLKTLDTMKVKLSQFEFNLSQSQLNLAEAKKIPNLRLSPVVQNYINDDVSNTMAGISFVFPIPIFDANTSERMQTLLTQKYAEKKRDLVIKQEDERFKMGLKKYQTSSSVLKEISVIEESLDKLKDISLSFTSGKLSISNFVEYCRQLDEIMHRYHVGEAILMNDLMDLFEQRGTLNQKTIEELL